jgi:hypothetical protein
LFVGLLDFSLLQPLEKHHFAIKLSVTSAHNLESWTLVVVYGPCRQPARDNFVN